MRISRTNQLIAVIALIILSAASVYFLSTKRTEMIGSLAVLPLQNLSGNPDNEFYADGMTEELITGLSRIGALRVISRTSAMRYKNSDLPIADIARELGVDAVVTGSVLRVEERMKIRVQLTTTEPERRIWEKTYEPHIQDILIMQDEVARNISDEINVVVTPEEKTILSRAGSVNPEVYDVYLKGRFYINTWTKESILQGIECFERALALDPGNAPARAGLAKAYNILASFDWIAPSIGWSRSRIEAMRALEIDENLLEAHIILADVKFMYDWDWQSARRDILRAIELSPGSSEAHTFYASYLMSEGHFDEAFNEIQLAREYDPLSYDLVRLTLIYFVMSRQYDRADRQAREILDQYPDNFEAHYWLGWMRKEQSRYEDAIEEYGKALALSVGSTTDSLRALAGFARTYALSGEEQKALAILGDLVVKSEEALITPFIVAKIYAALDEKDSAFEWLDRAAAHRSPYLATVKIDSELDGLRADPRFPALLRRMGIE